MNHLSRVLGIARPLIQAPMAGVGTPALAAAVSNAGGLGSLGIGAASVDEARRLIRATRSLTSKPVNINVFAHTPAKRNEACEAAWLAWLAPHFARFEARPPRSLEEIYTSFVEDPAMLRMLIEERPAVVSFHFGLPPRATIAALREAGILLLATATNLDEANELSQHDLSGIVAQGAEAGGHRGAFIPEKSDEHLGTFALTRLLVCRSRLPIIAAGGIMDGAGIAAALALGAQAVQLGTAFLACPETALDPAYRRAVLSESAHTRFTSTISGREARSLENAFTALDGDAHRPPAPAYPVAYAAGKALHAAAKARGFHGYGAQWAGQGVPLARALPASELVQTLFREFGQALAALHEQDPLG